MPVVVTAMKNFPSKRGIATDTRDQAPITAHRMPPSAMATLRAVRTQDWLDFGYRCRALREAVRFQVLAGASYGFRGIPIALHASQLFFGSVCMATTVNAERSTAITIAWIAFWLMVIGGVNWGLVGLFDFDLVAAIFGEGSAAARVVYTLVGLSALYCAFTLPRLRRYSTPGAQTA